MAVTIGCACLQSTEFSAIGVMMRLAKETLEGITYYYGNDAVGNRLAATSTLTSTQTHSYAYDDANRLVTADGVPYTWDDAGNLLADGVYTYRYDQEQRLVGVTGPGLEWSAGYDPDGLRRWQATNGVTTTYRLDLQPPLATVLQAGSLSGTISYLYGLGDSPLASETDGVWRYLSGRDALNSVRQETDAAGQVLAVRRFDPYGVPLTGDGGQPYGYSGEWWDAGTELVYLRARYLRPELGLFTTKDSWPGDVRQPGTLHGYRYSNNNPLRYIDPSGHAWIDFSDGAGIMGEGSWAYAFLLSLQENPGPAQATSAIIDFVPGLGDVKGFAEAFTGEDLITGETLDGWRFMGLIGLSEFRHVRKANEVVEAIERLDGTVVGGVSDVAADCPGAFSIVNWTGYPSGVPRPTGPFALLEGAEYEAAAAAKTKANRALRGAADPPLTGLEIHEIQPVKLGGSPTDLNNKIALDYALHRQLSGWWQSLTARVFRPLR